MIALLDVNVLVAVAWPEHLFHRLAFDWFDRRADEGWATCPMTEAGFVRISANAGVVRDAVRPADAAALLGQLCEVGKHHFWVDDVAVGDGTVVPLDRMTGHRQVTDGYLLGLSRHHRGSLATLDRGVVTLARGLQHARVELIAVS